MTVIRERIDYPELLRAIGHFIQQEHLGEVSVVEFERGWIITGLTYKSTANGFIRVPVDYVLSHDEVRTMIQKQLGHRRQAVPMNRGWRQ